MKTHPVRGALAKAGRSQAELARAIDVDASTLSNKLTGRRRWTQDEINRVLDYFREIGHPRSYDELFQTPRRRGRVA